MSRINLDFTDTSSSSPPSMPYVRAVQNCPHGVPKNQWCRRCTSESLKYINILRFWVALCEYAIVFGTIGLALTICLYAPHPPQSNLPEKYYWWILVPSSFMRAIVATVIGRAIILAADLASNRSFGISKWFSPTRMLKDWGIIAVVFSLMYAGLLLLLLKFNIVPEATSLATWIPERGVPMFIFAWLIIHFGDEWKWFTTGAIIPRTGPRQLFVSLYAILFVIVGSFIDRLLHWFILRVDNTTPFKISVEVLIAAVLMYCLMLVITRLASNAVKNNSSMAGGPIPATIAIVGLTGVGKSVFLVRSYALLQRITMPNLIAVEPTEQSREALREKQRALEEDREWFAGDVTTTEVPFHLIFGIKPIVKFNWLDAPGGVITKPESFPEATEEFYVHLEKSDAVTIMVNANLLVHLQRIDDLNNYNDYTRLIRTHYTRLAKLGPGAKSVPLAIIVTQSCRATPAQRKRLKKLVAPLRNLWISLAKGCGLKAPRVKIYLTSAVVIPASEPNILPQHPTPLTSENCVAPVLWLAAQVMRENASLLDVTGGFITSSPFQEAVANLETYT